MTYSRYFFPREPKIPTSITAVVIILLVVLIAKLFGSSAKPSKANKKVVGEVKILNLAYNQASIFWQTNEKEFGWVIYGQSENDLNKTALDERDLQDQKNLYYYHYVNLKNLQPNSEYFYKIVSNNQLVEANNEKSFIFKTPTDLSSLTNLNPAYGKVIKANGQPLENAIVILNFDKVYPLAVLSKSTGEWLIPLNSLIDKDSLKVLTIKTEDKILLEILSEDNETTLVTSNLQSISPLAQSIIIGKNYNLLNKEDVLSASSQNTERLNKIDILYPKDSSIIPGSKPIIKGTALPNGEVDIIIDTVKNYFFKTKADKQGIWTAVVDEPLSQGSHTLIVSTKDLKGKVVKLTRTFNLAKSGEQVLAAATPEASLTPTQTPTIFLSPTSFFTPYPTVSVVSTTIPPPPKTGTDLVPFSIVSGGLIVLGLGILLAF